MFQKKSSFYIFVICLETRFSVWVSVILLCLFLFSLVAQFFFLIFYIFRVFPLCSFQTTISFTLFLTTSFLSFYLSVSFCSCLAHFILFIFLSFSLLLSSSFLYLYLSVFISVIVKLISVSFCLFSLLYRYINLYICICLFPLLLSSWFIHLSLFYLSSFRAHFII